MTRPYLNGTNEICQIFHEKIEIKTFFRGKFGMFGLFGSNVNAPLYFVNEIGQGDNVCPTKG